MTDPKFEKPKIIPLQYKALRFAHQKDDPKRVYLHEGQKGKTVVTSYEEDTPKTRARFEKNVRLYKEFARHDIPCPRLLSEDSQKLSFEVEYAGQELPEYFQSVDDNTAKDAIIQAVEIIQSMARINTKESTFVVPERIKRFFNFYEEGKFSDSLPESTKQKLEAFYKQVKDIQSRQQDKKFTYGYTPAAGDYIDFVADEKGVVRIIDFDEIIEHSDPYYTLGYLHVSLEREKDRAELLKNAVLESVDWSQSEAKLRFKLGAIGALSNQLRIDYDKPESLNKRLGEIEEFLNTSV